MKTRRVESWNSSALLGHSGPSYFFVSLSWTNIGARLVRGFVTAAEKIVTNDNRGAMCPEDDDENKSREGE